MKATKYIHTDNFDTTACDMARVSFNKRAENYSKEKNDRLINYLIKHQHWTPFAHSTLCFKVYAKDYQILKVLIDKELTAGLNVSLDGEAYIVSGSLWAFLQLLVKQQGWSMLIPFIQELAPVTLHTFRQYITIDTSYALDIVPHVPTEDQHKYETLHIKIPIFVARQLDKHVVGFVKNEVSRRYVSDEPEFFEPEYWRGKAKDKKQGSSLDKVDFNPYITEYIDEGCNSFGEEVEPYGVYLNYSTALKFLYQEALDLGVCEEQARMILPQSMYTEYFLTANLSGWNRLLGLRLKEDTQLETRTIAKLIEGEI